MKTDFKLAASNYVKNRLKTTGNPQHLNTRSCERDFLAGIQYLLDLGYKSPKEVDKKVSENTSYMYDFMQDKW